MTSRNILISSAGRRNYLVRWFRDALLRNSTAGRVFVADSDEHAASRGEADVFVLLPPADSAEYAASLLDLCRCNHIDFAVSVNDFELSVWARMDKKPFEAIGTRLISLETRHQEIVEDKYAMSAALELGGIHAPQTVLASDVLGNDELRQHLGESVVIKDRFGSGSSGLIFSSTENLDRDLKLASSTVRDRYGAAIVEESAQMDALVIQPMVIGVEYGLDVVTDFDGEYAAGFVRRKLRMRGGETDKASSEDSARFQSLARGIARVVPHVGVVDADVIEDAAGLQWVIDINPRFGGGYPFSHLAGADAPSAYVAWSLARVPDPLWLQYEAGLISAKFQDIAAVGGRNA